MKNIDKELVTSLRNETNDHVISSKTYTIKKGKEVTFKNKKDKTSSDVVLQHDMVLDRDDLIEIHECSCCESLLYRFDHSKKKFLYVERDDLKVNTKTFGISSKDLYEDYEEVDLLGFKYIRTLTDEEFEEVTSKEEVIH